MACNLTQGRLIDCRNNTGGISEVLIANFENVQIGTVAAGVITAMTQTAATDFYRYNLEKLDCWRILCSRQINRYFSYGNELRGFKWI